MKSNASPSLAVEQNNPQLSGESITDGSVLPPIGVGGGVNGKPL